MSDVAHEGLPVTETVNLDTPSAEVTADQARVAELEAQLKAAQDALTAAQAASTAPAGPPEQLAGHVAPSAAQKVFDALDAGQAVDDADLQAAKDEVQRYLDTAGPMAALVAAWERLRQL